MVQRQPITFSNSMSTRREFSLGMRARNFLSFAVINLHRFVGIPPVYTRFRARDSWTKVHVSPPRIGTGIETKLLLPITKMKTAIIVISDPKAGEEAAGRAFNALATAK